MDLDGIAWTDWQYETRHGFTLRGQHTQPRGLPVLHFIHGNSYSGLSYLPLWRELQHDFDIFLHDAQGHGNSDAGRHFVGWDESARLAGEAWSAAGVMTFGRVPVFGCGHSFGGILTLMLSRQHPALFNELLLLDPILFPRRMILPMQGLRGLGLYTHNPYAKRARRRRSQWPDASSAFAGLHQRGMFKGWQDEALQAYVDHAMQASGEGQWQLKCPPHIEGAVFSGYASGVWRYLKRELSIPTQVWVGERTYPFVRRAVTRWDQHSDYTTLHWMPGGHCFMQESPQQLAQQMRAALPGRDQPAVR
ncbi:alpha/beta fold hydrolase [Aliidiomarina sp. Khilg15.8]